MTDFRVMVPFICHFAAGVYGKDGCELNFSDREIFELARLRGWSDDKDDPGGATMVDVTLSTYSSYKGRKMTKSELRNISFEEWMDILKTKFWDVCRGDEILSQGLANLIVDWVWASGPRVIKNLQKILGVRRDGIIGRETLGALNRDGSAALFTKIMDERERFYRNCPGAWKYLNGWLRRLRSIRSDGSFLIYGKIVKGEN